MEVDGFGNGNPKSCDDIDEQLKDIGISRREVDHLVRLELEQDKQQRGKKNNT